MPLSIGPPEAKTLAAVEARRPAGLDASPARDPLRRVPFHRTPTTPAAAEAPANRLRTPILEDTAFIESYRP